MVQLTQAQMEFLKRKIFASFSISSPTTKLPLVTTVWTHFEDGFFYIISNKATAKWRYLEAGEVNIGINITDPKGWPYLSVNGKAEVIFEENDKEFWSIIERIIKKYNSGSAIDQWLHKMKTAPKDATRFLIRLDPINVYSTV